MEKRTEFLTKLSGLVNVAKSQGSQISIDEVKAYFTDIELTEEQMELVFDYLLSQKVVVKGYLKVDAPAQEEKLVLTEEEEAYLQEYQEDLKAFYEETEGEREALFAKVLAGDEGAKQRLIEIYLPKVVEIAKEMYQEEIFLGDMVQEGNMGLILGMDMLTDKATAHQTIINQIKQCMQMLIEETAELSSRDKKMVEKVTFLDESITSLTEELGRKVTIDELILYTGLTEEEIIDILKLTGEDPEEQEE